MEATQEAQATSAPAVEAVKSDPWEGAEDAFNDALPEEPKAEVKAEESHLEPKAEEVPDYLKLDDLRIAHKYKPVVEERIKQIVSGLEGNHKSAIEAATQELGQNKEAVVSLVNIFRDIAQTPKEQVAQKIAGYIENYGQHLGIDPSTAQNLRTQEIQKAEAQEPVSISSITRKYRERMVQTQDPNEFMALWEQADIEKSQAMESQLLGKFGQLLKLYDDQYVGPDRATLKEFKNKSEREAETATYNSKKTSWNEAADGLKSKYEDFEKYKPQISKMIQEKKDLSAARDRLNEDLDDVESRQDFLERVYLALSRNDHIENAKRPRQGGLPPSQKHIQTTKTGGGGNWDSAYESTKHLWE